MPPKGKATGRPRGAKAGAHQLAECLPAGEVMRDCIKKEWKVGKPIGSGGFGLIYLADENHQGPVSDNAPYVMKVEPHANGPLFCELHFYQRVAKPDMIDQWAKSKKIKTLGVPQYITSGSYERNKDKYRFMVMERCGTDLQKIFENNGKVFSEKTVYNIGIRILNALEYIHEKEYVHADIKASNILTGFSRGKTDDVYLVDYGLAFRYTADGKHKEYKEDPKRVHDGTIEFTSRDAHRGVAPSRRGDLEILGYCMLQWLCGTLPWEDKLANKEYVRDQKIRHMKNVNALLSQCLPKGTKHDELARFLQYSSDLDYEERPDYNKCRQWFRQALKKFGGSESDKLVLTKARKVSPVRPAKPAKVSKKRKSDQELPPAKYANTESDSEDDFMPESPIARRRPITPKRATPASKGRATPKSVTPARSKSTTPRSASSARQKHRVTQGGDIVPMPAVVPRGLTNGTSAKKTAAKPRSVAKKQVAVASSGTQTSPGLKGLKRSRKK